MNFWRLMSIDLIEEILQKRKNTMEILKGFDIANGIRLIKPHKIAVAFIGSDYEKYVDNECLKSLESIIISPTEGSNPKAISKLVKNIGWNKIHFLSRLHAKMYIGKETTVIGSSNLSRNGLIGDESGLYEIGVKIDSKDEFDEIFNEILNEACEEFPDEQSKQKALEKLYIKYNQRKLMGLERDCNERTDFMDYDWNRDEHFYIDWYTSPDANGYTDETNEFCEKTDDIIENDIAFVENDKIEENKWVLYWKCQEKKEKIDRRQKPSWLYIDKIIHNGWKDEVYTKLAIQLKSFSSNRPVPPFEITKDFTESFRNVIEQEEYKILFNDNPYEASSEDILRIMPEFLADIKKDMTKNGKL